VLVSVDGQLVIAKLFAHRFVYVIPVCRRPATRGSGPALPCRDIRSLFGVNRLVGTAASGRPGRGWHLFIGAMHFTRVAWSRVTWSVIASATPRGALDLVGSVKTIPVEGMPVATSQQDGQVRLGQSGRGGRRAIRLFAS
jgi:hypothetical protein